MSSIDPNKKRLRLNISRGYLRFAWVIAVAVLFLSLVYARVVYINHENETAERLKKASLVVDRSLSDTLNYFANFILFLSRQIQAENPDERRISIIFNRMKGDLLIGNLSSATTFDWVKPNKMITVTSSEGILKNPISLAHRKNIADTQENPGVVIPNTPDRGVISKKWILPLALGINSEKGDFLGSVNIGIKISGILERVDRALESQEINYLLLSPDYTLVLDKEEKAQSFPSKEQLAKLINFMPDYKEGFLNEPFENNGYRYAYFTKVSSYPFIILAGYKIDSYRENLFLAMMYPVLAFFIIGTICISMLYIMYHRIIEPVVILSRAAKRISLGKYKIKIPRSKLPEIRNLSKQLIRIKKYKREAEAAREVAERANAAKSNFLASMSHELRTPLHTIMGYSDITRMGVYGRLPEKYQEVAGVIGTAADHLLKLIEDILDLAKIEAGKMELEESRVDVRGSIELAVMMVRTRAEAKDIKLKVELPERVPVLRSDELRMKQMLLNLLSNAVKFTGEGGVVTVGVEVGEELRIWVRDTGVGVAREEIPNILKEYGQARGITKQHREQGAGLGLAIVGRIMELHGGRLTFESEVGKGSVVTLLFPKDRLEE